MTYDARNHGTSFHSESMSYPEMSADLVDLISSHDDTKDGVVLMGHSMGGRTVMYTALTVPKIVNQLIVVDVSPCNVDFTTMDSTQVRFNSHSVTTHL